MKVIDNKFQWLIDTKKASLISSDVGSIFCHYIDLLPWRENRIDFEKIPKPYFVLNFWSESEGDICAFINKSTLSKHKMLAFVYDDDSPVLVSEYMVASHIFDEFLTYSGDVLVFGMDENYAPCFEDFMIVIAWQATGFLLVDR